MPMPSSPSQSRVKKSLSFLQTAMDSIPFSPPNPHQTPLSTSDPQIPLFNLSILQEKVDSLRRSLALWIDSDTPIASEQIDLASTEIASSIQQIILNGAALVSASQNQTVSPDIGDQTVRIAGNVSAFTSQKTSAVARKAADPIAGQSARTADFRDYRKNIQISGQVPDLKVNDISQFVGESQIAGEFSDLMYLNTTMYSQAACKIKEQITGKTAELSNIRCPIPVWNHEDMKFPTDFPVSNLENRKLVSAESKLPLRSIASARNSAHLRTSESEIDASTEIVELDTVELLAEHIHFCKICGKGFKRDANLRMHMRAHGNQFKTLEALAKPEQPEGDSGMQIRFSCPFAGCNRNKQHKQFRPLKSAVCVKNHFKRSHCPKMYSCNRCNKKSFSILADLKSHLKHCGKCRWRCSCGTSFSRKDKLFGHVALFEGHMPAIVEEKPKELAGEGETQMDEDKKQVETLDEISDLGFFDDVLEGFGPISGESFEDWLGLL